MIDSLGDRMKRNYEDPYKIVLPRRMPTIIRLDGRAFHTFTKKIGIEKPYDAEFAMAMGHVAQHLLCHIATSQFVYVQSDEISILLHPYKKLNTEPWFGNEVQKMVSVSASMASSQMRRYYDVDCSFDSRVFVLPEDEVVNYFIWRQKDCIRNAINGIGQRFFSHKELQGKSTKDIEEMMLTQYPSDWYSYSSAFKRGILIDSRTDAMTWNCDLPPFTSDRAMIAQYLMVEEW